MYLADLDKAFYFLTLGCPKNEVDSDCFVSGLLKAGWRMEERPEDAEILVVNTCSFIVPAVEESIEAVLELADLREGGRRQLVVAGCLVSRYGAQTLSSLLPEVDLFVDLPDYVNFTSIVGSLQGDISRRKEEAREHSSTFSRGYVYLKISEGCRRRCAYCAIPSIRGQLRSRPREAIREEALFFIARGAREIILIAQDTTSYGRDIYGEPSLHTLIEMLTELEGDYRLRIMYMHPEGVDEALLRAMRHPNVCNYLDLPFQHADPGVLGAMGRRGDAFSHRRLLDLVHERLGEVALRATLMVGFPGEDQAAFDTVYEFVAATRFDWLGLFSYSQEEGTPAFSLGKGVPETVARRRMEELAVIQDEIMQEKALAMVGRRLRVLVEGESVEAPGFWEARSWREAPEIDGVIFVPDGEGLGPSTCREVEITASEGIDLVGVIKTRQEQAQSDKGRG